MKNIFIFICFLGSIGYAKAACNTVESTAQSGGYLVLRVGKIMLEDVTTFKEIDDKVFYSISPIYGASRK